ncbi:MAG: thiol-disulfide oxidoreductase DCC family protein [Lacisediminihabitans sp.]
MPRILLSKPANGALLVFDGECGFCTTAVTWLERALPAFPAAIPYQWADLDAIGLSTDEAAARVWLVTPDHQYGGHLAASALLRHQPDIAWRFLGWLIETPPFSWAAAASYALVAKYRQLLPGGTPACKARPAPEDSGQPSAARRG